MTLPAPPCGNEDAFLLSCGIQSVDGARVSLTYRALRWGPVTMRAIQDEDEQTEEFRRYYNQRVIPRLGVLITNVELQGPGSGREPGFKLAPGMYRVGFQYQGDDNWVFIASVDNPGREDIVHPAQVEPLLGTEVPFLNMSLLPGSDAGRMELAVHYGPYKVSLPLTISGIPIGEGGTAPDGSGARPVGVGVSTVDSATPTAGSGLGARATELGDRWLRRSPTPVKRAQSGTSR